MNPEQPAIMAAINHFIDERQWRPYHNAKDLALSISIEAAELLECFQWRTPEEATQQDLGAIQEELADVLIYSYQLADHLGLDIETIMADKLRQNARKYPVPDAQEEAATDR